ncbi:MAG: hypothetical protein A2074_04575 [Candidatus Aquicultor primus]|uniref:Uncharacterized protein n=1 Tax=Candidatus Aquicultor primus TaxID=1797195 RepID=A0A1F2UIB6_9ACTN|nr:MAG: hypothetical protein A2074_04575 [Candidatus Aquicultor primus]
MKCPECGAPGSQCQERFNEFLALEFSDAAFFAVHHLTVATFMLQHSSRLSREGWICERELLSAILAEDQPPDSVGKQARHFLDGGGCGVGFKSKDGLPVVAISTWTKTILDVCSESADVYARDITSWARAALEEANKLDL